jgi:DNA recombination protein RmuC
LGPLLAAIRVKLMPMTDSWLIPTLLLFAIAAAAYFGWRWQEANKLLSEHGAKAAEVKVRLEQIDQITRERDEYRAEAGVLAQKLAAEQATSSARAAAAAEKEAALLAIKADVEKSFETLANRALGNSEQRFLTLANETFEKHKSAAAGGVKEVVAPVQEQFAKLSETIAALDKARTEDKSAIGEQMRQIGEAMAQTQTVTGKLANALRAGPKTRGRWGEETLRNVLEMSGLTQRVDFVEQASHDSEGGKLRPDVIIRLPGGRVIVVDSKVALSGYMDAMDATDEATREAYLRKHALELKTHVKQLASKDYWKHVPDTADFVVLFVPGENFLSAAAERDPNLFEDAFSAQVIIATPSTMVALAKSVAYGWRQEESTKNAQEITDLGKELYRRLSTMSDHLGKVGDAINKSVTTYNAFVSSMETRVMPQARRFRDLGVADSGAELSVTDTIDALTKLPAPPAEFELTPPPAKAKRN